MSKVRLPEPEGFASWWAEWLPIARHTDGRGLARETYRKHILNGADPADILDGARWFKRSLSERDKEFVPLSSTWLNRESYLDFAEKERAYQERLSAQPTNVVQIAQPRGQTAFLRAFNQKQG